jgi:gluconolactonase
MAIVALDPRLNDLVDPAAAVEQIGSGFVFTEGPAWHARERHLTFSDVRGDAMYRWTESGGVAVFRKPSAVANGNTYDRQGRLVTCEHTGRRLSRTAGGEPETVVSSYEGKRLNSPNDVICLANGDLVFTDPPYGLRRADGSFDPGELGFNGVFRLSATDGSLRLLTDEFERPNGLAITDDGARMYIADTQDHIVKLFDVAPDGSLANGRVFADVAYAGTTGRPDGMKLDSLGNVYVAANTAEGVWVFGPEGTLLGFIGVGEGPANLAWGGDDWRTLFVTASTSVYRLPMKVAGQPLVVA